MRAIRPVRPTDLVALVSFEGRVYPNEARTWDRLGTDEDGSRVLSAAVDQWFSFATRHRTWISIRGQTILGMVSARNLGTPAAWEIDTLIPASAEVEDVTLSLLEQVSAGAARAGTQKLFLRLEAGSDLIWPARKAGFVPYRMETLLRLDDAGAFDAAMPEGANLRPREKADVHGLFQLYCRVAPAAARMIEATTLTEWEAATERRSGGRGSADLVLEREGRITGWLRTARAGGACRLDLMLDPAEWSATDALTTWALRDLGRRRPVLCVVGDHARPVQERLVTGGFQPAGEYELFAKRLAQPVRVPRAVRATAKPVATV